MSPTLTKSKKTRKAAAAPAARKKTTRRAPARANHRAELEKRMYHLKTLFDLTQEISYVKETPDIMKTLLMMIMGTFGAMSGVVLLVNPSNRRIEALAERGMDQASVDILFGAVESGFFEELRDITGFHILASHGDSRRKKADKKRVADLLSSFRLDIWIPFTVNEELIGAVGLGEKMTGDPYTEDDHELLSTLANQGAVSIHNAKLVEKMKKEEVIRTNLARYLSPQIVDQVISQNVKVDLGGHRKVVTVLFSDIRNFTTLSESRPPDQLVRILNEYFTAMAGAIFENEGSLDKYIGDAMVAIFGSLITVENHARSALMAAAAMMRKMEDLNRHWHEAYDGFQMQIGIGVNTGDVFLGNIGCPERMEFSVIGDTVNVASRFSSVARAGQILLSRSTLEMLDGHALQYGQLPSREIKGKSKEIELFECYYRRGHDPFAIRPA